MLKKIIPSLFIILFLSIFGYFYGDEYRDFQKKSEISRQQEIKILEEIQDFSLQDIRELESAQFYDTPDKNLLDTLVNKINNAEDRVYLEVYIFTEKRIRSAIKSAYQRGVDVKVILEKNPYLAPRLNDNVFNELEDFGIDIVWSDTSDYALNHAKFMIVDDEVVISTGNMSYSTFAYNKDFFIITKDDSIVANLVFIFENDFAGEKISPYDHNLVLSPVYSREKFETLFLGAESSIQMYFQYFQDDELAKFFIEKATSKDIAVQAIVAEVYADEHRDEIIAMKDAGVEIKYIKKPKMHAKAILIDKKYLFIGSINFSSYSLDSNREVGILIKNPKIISEFLTVFNADFSSAENIE